MSVETSSHPRHIRKLKFTGDEDLKLVEIINELGCLDWRTIASRMKNRSVRQCRDRWCQYLNPFISHFPWTDIEDALLRQKVAEYGTKWSKIAVFFPARTKINLKNRWRMIGHQCRDMIVTDQKPQPRYRESLAEFDRVLERAEALWNEQSADWLEISPRGARDSP
jgi:hypothetical protein